MRARIISSLICLFSFCTLSAQTSSANPVAFKFNGGIIGGATLSQIHGDGVGGFNKIGFNLGATVEMRNSRKKSLQLGVVYNQKGSRKPPNPSAGDWDTWAYRFTYIDLPVTLNYRYSSIEFIVGLQPSLLVAAEEDFFGVSFEPTTIPIKKWDLCGVIGIRTQYGDHTLLVAHLTQSIIAIAPVPTGDPLLRWDNRMMNMTLELGVVYLVGRI